MTAWELPTSLTVGGVARPIRTDFRVMLDILDKLQDPAYEDDEKALIFLDILYPDFAEMDVGDYEEAMKQAVRFLDAGTPDNGRSGTGHPVMDWGQDAGLIIPAVNRVMGKDVRSVPYDSETNTGGLHWWTFISAYMEIGECLYSSVLSIRQKRARHKKLEKNEKEFYKENKQLIDIKPRRPAWTEDENDALAAIRNAVYKKTNRE